MATQRLRDRARKLIEDLPQRELPAACWYLEYLNDVGDPLLRQLQRLPVERRKLTPRALAALRQAHREARRGRGRAWEALRRELAGG